MGLQRNETNQCFLWFNEKYRFVLFSYLSLEHILILKKSDCTRKNVDNQVNNDHKEYKIETDFKDQLEGFSFRENCFTDHWLFLLIQSPSFANLKVIDLRGNNIKSLMCLKVNHNEIYEPMLKELYIYILLAKTIPYNISFLFEILYLKFDYFNVLWVEAHEHNLYNEKEERNCHEVGGSINKNNSNNMAWKYKFIFMWHWLYPYALSKYFVKFEELWGASNQEMQIWGAWQTKSVYESQLSQISVNYRIQQRIQCST